MVHSHCNPKFSNIRPLTTGGENLILKKCYSEIKGRENHLLKESKCTSINIVKNRRNAIQDNIRVDIVPAGG